MLQSVEGKGGNELRDGCKVKAGQAKGQVAADACFLWIMTWICLADS